MIAPQIKLTFLGTSSSYLSPNNSRKHSSILVEVPEENFLFDVGEGVSSSLFKKTKVLNKIKKVFITHLHVDHYGGIFGFINTLHQNKIENEIEIYSPDSKQLQEMFEIYAINPRKKNWTGVKTKFIELSEKSEIITENFKILFFKTKHNIKSFGIILKDKKEQNTIKYPKFKDRKTNFEELYKKLDINKLSTEEFFIDPEKNYITHFSESFLKKRIRKITYTSDTGPSEEVENNIKDSTLLITECTHDYENKNKRNPVNHLTNYHAALMAKKGNVEQLILTHFSEKINPTRLLLNTKKIFPTVELAEEKKVLIL